MQKTQLRGLACEEDDLKRQVLEETRVREGFQWCGEAQKTATPAQVWTHDGFYRLIQFHVLSHINSKQGDV